MSLLEEIHSRHQNFHRVIARRAAAIVPKPVVEIPKPQPVLRPLHPYYLNKCMWFYDLIQPLKPQETRKIEDIKRVTAQYYGVTSIDMICNRRTKELVRPRQVAMYLCKTLTPKSLPEIGRRFGNRDHTTVLHAVRKIERLIQTDSTLSAEIAEIAAKFPKGNT